MLEMKIMKKLFFILSFLLIGLNSFSQQYNDIIVLKSKDTIYCDFRKEVNDTVFYYSKSSPGVLYHVKNNEIIEYQLNYPEIARRRIEEKRINEAKNENLSFKDSTITPIFQKYAINYVANIPKLPLGVSGICKLKNSNSYLYFDVKLSVSGIDMDHYYDNISKQTAINWGDNQIKSSADGYLVNIGVAQRLNYTFSIYFGIGFSEISYYLQYHDDTGILGDNGDYWIKDDKDNSVKFNATGGLILYVSKNIDLQFGFDTSPGGLNLGIGYCF